MMTGFPCPVPVELVVRLAGAQGAMLLIRARARGLIRRPWSMVDILAGQFVADIDFEPSAGDGALPPSIRIVLGIKPEARAA